MIVVLLTVWFGTLDARHLLRSDEGRYAEIAREMFASGDYVTVRYNDLKYFEKPPLHLWMTALAYDLFGVGDWQARLWAAISGVIGFGATMFAADRWFGRRVAALGGLVLLAAPGWNLGGHFNSLDITVTAWLTCTLAAFLVAQHPDSAPRRDAWLGAAWVAMALATLSKGLIGIVLPGLAGIVYMLAARDWTLWRRLWFWPGLLCFLAVAAPWFVLVSLRNPEFPQFFFIHEHWQRYTSEIHRRDAPLWYFVPQLLGGFLPWLGLLVRGRSVVAGAAADPPAGRFRPRLLLLAWAVSIVAFFSLSDSKLPGYVLPVYPALAILGGLALDRLDAAAWRRQLLWMAAVAALGLAATPFLPHFGSINTPVALYRRYAVYAAAMFAVALAAVVLAWRAATTAEAGRASFRSILVAAVGWFLAITIGLVGHETFGRGSSGVDLVPAIDKVLTPEMPLYSVRLLDHTLPFYLRHTTIMVEAPDELEFGTLREPQKWLPTVAAFEARWRAGPRALAVMSPATWQALQRDALPGWPVAQDARRVVVANFPVPPP